MNDGFDIKFGYPFILILIPLISILIYFFYLQLIRVFNLRQQGEKKKRIKCRGDKRKKSSLPKRVLFTHQIKKKTLVAKMQIKSH